VASTTAEETGGVESGDEETRENLEFLDASEIARAGYYLYARKYQNRFSTRTVADSFRTWTEPVQV
jgi:hypothetical protein